MNAVDLFLEQQRQRPDSLAIWLPGGKQASFSELAKIGARTQKRVRENGIGPGDTVLVFEPLGPRLYGCLVGLLSMGVSVALVEPWMPAWKINHALTHAKPKAFLCHPLGRLWGLRVSELRKVPWLSTGGLERGAAPEPVVESVAPDSPAIVTFTSGTTGPPKGMVRTHGYLVDQHRILTQSLHSEAYEGPDLCIFANFALANLASGRASLIVPPGWKSTSFRQIAALPAALQPETLTCGPAFLRELMSQSPGLGLRSIHVGGALTDCAIFEQGFKTWPDAEWVHLYGSTEVEPVATADARKAVRLSRERGFFQTLYLGTPIEAIESRLESDTLWVTGPHVCPRYLGNEEENRKCKKLDSQGRVWHRMGDRILSDQSGWWYGGRENQRLEDFQSEQKLYSLIRSSAAFIAHQDGAPIVYTQKARKRRAMVQEAFPEVKIQGTRIRRDRRHRARIDRQASQRSHPWQNLLG